MRLMTSSSKSAETNSTCREPRRWRPFSGQYWGHSWDTDRVYWLSVIYRRSWTHSSFPLTSYSFFIFCWVYMSLIRPAAGTVTQTVWSLLWSSSRSNVFTLCWCFTVGPSEHVQYLFTCVPVCTCVCCVYLRRIDIIQHDDGRAVVVEDQTPKVLHCVRQRMLGNNEGWRLLVALQQ